MASIVFTFSFSSFPFLGDFTKFSNIQIFYVSPRLKGFLLFAEEEIDSAITHLDKLRSNIQTEYEQTLKPLLVAAMGISKIFFFFLL